MRQEWDPEDLVGQWTLVEAEMEELVEAKWGATQLGFALMLKFFQIEARFPRHAGELPSAAVAYVARQIGVDPGALQGYEWTGRTIEYHRGQIRRYLGFRRFSEADEVKLAGWLADEVAPVELSDERLREALLARCREEGLEPPARVARIIGTARAAVTTRFTAATVARLPADTVAALEALAGLGPDGGDPANAAWLAELKADPGQVSRASVSAQIERLNRVRRIGLPAGLFDGWSEQLLAAWRARAATEYPSDLRGHSPEVRRTLLAVLVHVRAGELADGLVDLLLGLVHKIETNAERSAHRDLTADLHRVHGKEAMLYRVAEVALKRPEDTVREAVYPVIAPDTLAALVAEGRATESALRTRTRDRLRSSYSSYYRIVIPGLLASLEFRSSNTVHAPVIAALALLARYTARPYVRRYDPAETVPLDGIVPAAWRAAVADENGRIERIPYELCVLSALRAAIRRREVWVAGARRWRDPDADLPADFAAHRDTHYSRLGQPLDAEEFITTLRGQLGAALEDLDAALGAGDTGGVKITTRRGQPWITVPKLGKAAPPANLDRLKAAVLARWGSVDLLDFLTEADHHIGLVDAFPSIASREVLPEDTLRERLLLVLFALGTNTGIAHVAAGGHGHSEATLRHVRRLFLTTENLRAATTKLINATYAARDPRLWGTGTACASDSKKFGSWESNLMTEWHARYRGPGVMIYWHVEAGRLCVYSQLKSCSSSEVAAMMEGLLHHGTDVPVAADYTDTHGASVIGFAFTHLLGYSLLPRLKDIGRQRLYLPDSETGAGLKNVQAVLTRPIRWDLISQQYDQMVRYATALKLRTAEAEQILARFRRPGPQHPTHTALLELGRAVKTLFVVRYLRSEALRREINDGLQVVENWNSANKVLFYGKDSELTGADRDDLEISVLALHLLQSALVYINTLLLERVIADLSIELTPEDLRAITPLFWTHVRPYGRFDLHLDRHLDLDPHPAAA